MLDNRVQETTTTTGTGTISLLGAPAGKVTFANAPHIGNGGQSFYCITNGGSEWEAGISPAVTSGSPDTLARSAGNVIAGSSGAGVLVNFSAGTKTVFNSLPAGFQCWPFGSDIATAGAIDNLDPGARGAFRLTACTSLTGIAGGAKGKMHLIVNANTVAMTLANDATSTAANRFYTGIGGTLTIPAGASFLAIYDSTALRWRVMGGLQIGAGAIASDKLADMAQATAKGRAAGAGTGVPGDLTATQLAAIVKTVGGALMGNVVSFTIDLSAANGTTAVTGVGFRPKLILFFGGSGQVAQWSATDADSATAGAMATIGTFATGINMSTNALQFITDTGAANGLNVAMASYDSDGFTLTRTKFGAPTGTMTIKAVCFR